MFAILDTNHFTEMVDGSALGENLRRRTTDANASLFTTIITVQEVTQGWLAVINRHPSGPRQMNGYAEFQHNIGAFCKLTILRFDKEAVSVFEALRRQRLHIGSMDLKIASICLAHDSTLLTRNLVDFQKVPGLRVENWLD